MLQAISSVIEWTITNPVTAFALLFVEYVVIMTLYYKTKHRAIARALAVPFVVQDALVNWFVLSIVFLEIPKEALVTSRLKRWKNLPLSAGGLRGIRAHFAWWMCHQLNKFDPGHC